MGSSLDPQKFLADVEAFRAQKYVTARVLALYAASVAISDEPGMTAALKLARQQSIERPLCYEIVLQSYLFLGFPRMLAAIEHLEKIFPSEKRKSALEMVSEQESKHWYINGLSLCKRIYGSSFEPLKKRIEALSPDIFRWMIIEGYGKVLSRPGLGIVERELANVAFLLVEDREQQLHSHMRGALNVGATEELLSAVVHDIGDAGGSGYATALDILKKFGIK